ncbi:uncharacterized protein LOC116898356, partial [Rattus rattus]|uniref:uncharacterized protein LOC116898356 n=1 Tax=Rattus rattus TaxID=10117 RepID=UPI0013F2EF4E
MQLAAARGEAVDVVRMPIACQTQLLLLTLLPLLLVAGRWSLVAGRWSLVAGRWSLVAGRWSLVAGRCIRESGNVDAASESEEPVSGEALSIAHALSYPPKSYGNDPDTEMAWAIRAMQHAEVYYKLTASVDSQFLKLTKVDDQIYSEFREIFETLRVDVLDLEELKSESAIEKTLSLHPGFNFLPLKLLGTRKAITKQFWSVFRTKKERKELTIKKRKLRKELIVEEKKRKEST